MITLGEWENARLYEHVARGGANYLAGAAVARLLPAV